MAGTPVCTIDATGIHVPTYADCLAFYQDGYLGIYGSDVYLGADCQDGQWLAIQASALNDTNAATEACFNAFSPATAQGTGLSIVVKINGIARDVPTFSSADLVIVGPAGTVITAGIAADAAGNRWSLPATVLIPLAGQITVTALAVTAGALTVPAGSITQIVTPTLGWQSVTNPTAGTPGAPLETDAALRIRQSHSTMIPAQSVFDGLVGAVLAVPGVQSVTGYENSTNIPDVNGIPGHCVSLVITGGADADIAAAIEAKKGPGVNTYGSSTVTVTNKFGIPRQIAFFRPISVPISYVIVVKALQGFTADVQASFVNAIAAWTNALGVGQNVRLTRAYVPANLSGGVGSAAYEVVSLAVARDGAATGTSDITIAFNEQPSCDPTYIQVQVQTS